MSTEHFQDFDLPDETAEEFAHGDGRRPRNRMEIAAQRMKLLGGSPRIVFGTSAFMGLDSKSPRDDADRDRGTGGRKRPS